MTDRSEYRYFRLDGATGGEWPADHPFQVGAITRITGDETLPGSAWNEATRDWVHPQWVETTNPANPIPLETDGLREAVLAYINLYEHKDDWGVPCVYTKDLRALLAGELVPTRGSSES